MLKVLISWLAFHEDFKEGKMSKEGPTYKFHELYYKHDLHLILSSSDCIEKDTKMERLLLGLKKDFPDRRLEATFLDITDLISLSEIKLKTEKLLLEYKDHQIDIYFSPGTPMMKLSWYLCHTTLNLNTTIYQTRPIQFIKKDESGLIKLEIDKSNTPVSAMIRELDTKKTTSNEYLITESIKNTYDLAYKIAQTDNVTTLIQGDSGTGKEHLAHYIHDKSARCKNPFLAINCSAFGDTILESRLFGHKKGSFTDASSDHKGLFEQANKGTLFLDEIGDMSAYMQQSLLRVLQEQEIQIIGGETKKINVRIIAATHRNLIERCKNGAFRWDLFYRLSVTDLTLPSLLERGKKEKRDLIDHFLKLKKKKFNKKKTLILDKKAKNIILDYPFPGNIRELENLIERLYVFCDEKATANDLPKNILRPSIEDSIKLEDITSVHTVKILKSNAGNIRKTATDLGVSENTVRKKIELYEKY